MVGVRARSADSRTDKLAIRPRLADMASGRPSEALRARHKESAAPEGTALYRKCSSALLHDVVNLEGLRLDGDIGVLQRLS